LERRATKFVPRPCQRHPFLSTQLTPFLTPGTAQPDGPAQAKLGLGVALLLLRALISALGEVKPLEIAEAARCR